MSRLSLSRSKVSLWSAAMAAGALAIVACSAESTPTGSGGIGGDTGLSGATSGKSTTSSTSGSPTTGSSTTGTSTTGTSTTGSSTVGSSAGGSSTNAASSGSQAAGSGGAGGSTCPAGTCVCSGGQILCGSSCVDSQSDSNNCGACGTTCEAGQVCQSGVCGCMPGRTSCAGACVDTSADANNCGLCGTKCTATQVCANSQCTTSCMTEQTACSGACFDLNTSIDHCGACATACTAGQTCAGGTCSCATGQTNCSGTCKTLTTDAANCGACGNACAAGQTCANGMCTGSTGGTVCKFASGLNVAWVNFANDVPNPNLTTFNTIFKNTYAAGGRIVRWWFHTNGSVTPGYDASGKAKPLPQSHIDGVKAILKSAHDAGIGLNISLWSFDMLQTNAGDAHTNNQLLLENDANRQAYIDNYLTPLVTALKGTPGLYSYEIFNEPEGMGPNGWATYRTTEAFIQKTVNWFAAAIHTADPNVLVTNGAVTFDYCSYASGKNNYYSDTALRNAGGKQNGTLDFYEVHYYTSNGASNSPFTHAASTWGLAKDNKNLVIGEFAAQATDGVAQNDLFTALYTGGYNGAWAWAYTSDWPWPAMQTPMQNLFNAHSDVGSCP